MSLQFLSLASGSSGNCYYLGNEEYGILIDAGKGVRTIKKVLKEYGIPFEKIVALCITHDHADHIKAAGTLGEKYGIPIYTTEAIKNGKDPFADEKSGKNCKTRKNGDAGDSATTAPSVGGTASSPSTGDSSSASTPKLTGKAFHDASKRVSAIERKLAKLEEQKADLEAQMAAHDPSDYEGLGKLNEQLQSVTDESESLEMEWMELSEQLE